MDPLGFKGLSVPAIPKGPYSYMVYTWALKGFLYPYFGVYLCTMMILGPFGYCATQRPEGPCIFFLTYVGLKVLAIWVLWGLCI